MVFSTMLTTKVLHAPHQKLRDHSPLIVAFLHSKRRSSHSVGADATLQADFPYNDGYKKRDYPPQGFFVDVFISSM